MNKLFKTMMAMAITALTFTACEDVPEPYNNPYDGYNPIDNPVPADNAVGTLDAPKTVAEALAAINAMDDGATSTEFWFVTGKVVKVTTSAANFQQYKNLNYLISADGTEANTITVYAGNGLDDTEFSGVDALKAGDVVVVYGKLQKYVNKNTGAMTPEIAKGNYLVKLTPGSGETPTPSADAVGSKDAPKTVAEALATINAMEDGATSAEFWFVAGKVVKVTTSASNFEQYKNLNYLISADGTETNTITVYAGNGLNNTQFSGIDALKAGDEVVVYGQLQKYVNKNTGAMTPEIAKGNYLVKLTPGSGGNVTPTPTGEAKGSGTQADPFNAVAANAKAGELAQGETSSESYYVKGKISQIKYTFSAQYGTATFHISDDGKTENEFYIYSTLYLENKSWVDGNTQIAVGDEVVICGQFTNYNGTLETASKKSYIYSLNGKTTDDGGGEQTGNGGVLEGNTLTVVYGDLGISSIDSPVKLVDGTTLTFSKEDGKNNPIYHESTKIVRMYAHNSVTINAGSKKIASVVFNYDTYQGTAYCGNDELYGEAGGNKLTPAKDDKTVSFTGVNASTLKVMNDLSTGNSGGVQFRCTGLVITFAQ